MIRTSLFPFEVHIKRDKPSYLLKQVPSCWPAFHDMLSLSDRLRISEGMLAVSFYAYPTRGEEAGQQVCIWG